MYQQSIEIVKATSLSGHKESELNHIHYLKWLDIWTLGLLGECGEAIEALVSGNEEELQEEIADICWYSIALELHLKSDEVKNFDLISGNEGDRYQALIDALLAGLSFSEKVKKFTRDYPERGTIKDTSYMYGYSKVLEKLSGKFDFTNVGQILDKKLSKRYPKGFDPKMSVNR